ncbi:MAG: hypothetical protein IH586_06885, partial [Anaerolineaceae bacterium]|nr:hypothetical protein [Anaerolineaceae bacterium]
YKGNTHIHSTASDGGKTFAELAQMYSGAGYDFLCRTDHWVASDAAATVDADATVDAGAGDPLLWLDGIELDGVDESGAAYHVVALGRFSGLAREMGLHKALESARAQGGMLILAHPQWMGNTFEDAWRWNFDGVEVYNHVCRWLNGKGDGSAYWNAALAHNPNTLALAVDDAHLSPGHPGWNGGWVMVNAAQSTPQSILAALRAGNFYASCGPQIETIEFDGEQVHLACSPVQFARMVGPRWMGQRVGSFDGNLLTRASFVVDPAWPYAYLEIEDAQGRKAWSNPLFME